MSAEAGFSLLFDQQLECGETPAWDFTSQCLFWTDSGAKCIYSARVDGQAVDTPAVFRAGLHAAAIMLHEDGGLVCGGASGFYHLSSGGEVYNYASSCNGIEVTNINEIIGDPAGRVIGGQEAYREGSYETGFLFTIDLDGKMNVLETGLHNSNGMGFSPDNRTFYLTDTIKREIYAYEYSVRDGTIKNKRTLIRLSREDGLPDGLTVDSEGFIWVASWFGGALLRYDPQGILERKRLVPVSQPTSLCFGGPLLNEIFMTSAAVNWVTDLAPPGFDYAAPKGGGIYRMKQSIQGKPEFRAKIKTALCC